MAAQTPIRHWSRHLLTRILVSIGILFLPCKVMAAGASFGHHVGYSRLLSGSFEDAFATGMYPLIAVSAAWEEDYWSLFTQLEYGYNGSNHYIERELDYAYRATQLRVGGAIGHSFGCEDCRFKMRSETFGGPLVARHSFEAYDSIPDETGSYASLKDSTTGLGGFVGLGLNARIGRRGLLQEGSLGGLFGTNSFLLEIPLRQTWSRQRVQVDAFGLDELIWQSTTTLGFVLAL